MLKRYATTFIFFTIMIVAELHCYFDKFNSSNWIVKAYRPMSDAWNVKYAGLQLIYILYPLAALLWVNNRTNKVTAIAFICWGVLDTIMYFWNYKTGHYGSVYWWYMAIWLLIYYGQKISKLLWLQLKHWGIK